MFKSYTLSGLGMFGLLTLVVTIDSQTIRVLMLAPVFVLYLITMALIGIEYDKSVSSIKESE